MNKIYTLSLLILLNLCAPTICSEPSWTLKKLNHPKHWFTTQCYSLAQEMTTKHTYEYNSSEHKQDMAILSVLPAHISQAVLCKQRKNMKNFLIKNEENALEGVRQYFNIDQKEWSEIMSQVKKYHEFNLNEMRKDQNFNTYHDPDANIFMPEINRACKKYSINPKSLNIGTQTSLPNAHAITYTYPPTQGILWYTYNPGTINFNKKKLVDILLPAGYLDHLASHELTHVMQGHHTRNLAILNHQKICSPFGVGKDKITYEKYQNSIASKNFSAAQEKTADTFLSCSDPEAVKNATIAHYPDNFNDIHVLNTNWETSQEIEKLQNRLRSTTKNIK